MSDDELFLQSLGDISSFLEILKLKKSDSEVNKLVRERSRFAYSKLDEIEADTEYRPNKMAAAYRLLFAALVIHKPNAFAPDEIPADYIESEIRCILLNKRADFSSLDGLTELPPECYIDESWPECTKRAAKIRYIITTFGWPLVNNACNIYLRTHKVDLSRVRLLIYKPTNSEKYEFNPSSNGCYSRSGKDEGNGFVLPIEELANRSCLRCVQKNCSAFKNPSDQNPLNKEARYMAVKIWVKSVVGTEGEDEFIRCNKERYKMLRVKGEPDPDHTIRMKQSSSNGIWCSTIFEKGLCPFSKDEEGHENFITHDQAVQKCTDYRQEMKDPLHRIPVQNILFHLQKHVKLAHKQLNT